MRDEIVRKAFEAFGADVAVTPPLTLRSGYARDSYGSALPYDAADDESTDAYLETYTFWGLAHLDPLSWRHYLPRLIEYSLSHLDDPHMVVEGLFHSLRPPDHEPSRLGLLSRAQEAVITTFLEQVAFEGASANRELALQILDEWWLPNARYRTPRAEDV